jgi:hypothetical protein
VAVLEGAFLLGLAPEDLVIAVGVERRIDVDQVHAALGELAQLLQAIAAVDDARVEPTGAAGAAASSAFRESAGSAFGFFAMAGE